MKWRNPMMLQEMDPSVERILNEDDDYDFDYENEEDIAYESAMEPQEERKMFIDLVDSYVSRESINAVAKSVIPETNFTPVYYTMCIYLLGAAQPLVHTYETEEERDAAYNKVCELLNEQINAR